MKQTALHAMMHGELYWTADIGWRSSAGISGIWNTHTIRWLAGKRHCFIRGARAAITSEGRAALDGAQEWAA